MKRKSYWRFLAEGMLGGGWLEARPFGQKMIQGSQGVEDPLEVAPEACTLLICRPPKAEGTEALAVVDVACRSPLSSWEGSSAAGLAALGEGCKEEA